MDNNKMYKLGLICGRFSHIHNGHLNLIEHSLTLCNKTLIMVGSAQDADTLRNPFSIDLRIELIKQVYADTLDNLIIKGLNDMTNEYDITHDWGKFVKNHVEKYAGEFCDLIINGDDKSREGWFSPDDLKNTSRLIVSRSKIPVSATRIRTLLALNMKDDWEKYTPKQIHGHYNGLRNKLMNIPIYKTIYDETCKIGLSIENFETIYKQYEKLDQENKIKNN